MKNNEMLSKMLVLATNTHHGQFDKAGKPYILHCLHVMHNLNTTDEELMCIALGHDLCEDTSVTFLQFEQEGFTQRIVNGIRAMTKQRGESYEEYKQKVFANKDAVLVKMADLQHNTDIRRLKGVTQKDIERTIKYHSFYEELKQYL
jgi:(p)ppGpp synthase/HD superfamily hydrolase